MQLKSEKLESNFASHSPPQNAVSLFTKRETIYVLVVAKATDFTERIKSELSRTGYCVKFVDDSEQGWVTSNTSYYNLIILDWTLSPITGLELCQRLRSIRKQLPIMMLMEQGTTNDRVAALEAGADDCITASLEMTEVLARVQARLRHEYDKKSDILYYSDLILNQKSREVYRDGSFIQLTAKEFDLLAYFMRHPQQVLTHIQILENVWGYDFMGNSNIIEVYVRYLRCKLEAGGHIRLIHTIRLVGYVLRLQIRP